MMQSTPQNRKFVLFACPKCAPDQTKHSPITGCSASKSNDQMLRRNKYPVPKAISLAALLTVTAAFPTAAETIRVGMSGGYFPFTFVEQDKLQGFEVDLMNALAERTGDTVEFSTMSFSGLIGALEAGRIDTVANQITITPDRAAKFAFSQPYVYDGAQVVVKLGNETTITGVDSLRVRTVAVNLGSNFEQLLRDLPFAAEIDIRTYESNIEQDTALGRVDAFVMDRVSSAQVIKQSPLPLA